MKLSDRILRKPFYVAFGQALQGGGITSVDLAATRDASTVTVTASDGSAAPIPSADASTAGVLSAADKVKLDGLPVAAAEEFPARANVATATVPAGISHIRTAGYAAPGDGGGALYMRVASAPAHALYVQSGDGAFWELVADNGAINVLQAGADPTGVADSIQAFRDCAAFAEYNTGDEQSGGANGPTIIVPQGKYYWSDTFEPRAGITMIGAKRGVDGNLGTIIQVAADKTGIILPKNDTLGTGKESPDDSATKGANGSFLQGFRLESLGGTDATKHGIHVRTPSVMLSHIETRQFPGDGFHVRASVGGAQPADQYGNANLWRIEHCFAFDNQESGFYIAGSDVNGGVSIACNAVRNGRWGIWDSSFLSNVHVGAHAQGNGHGNAGENQARGITCNVTHNGNRYVVVPGQETLASTTEPGTDDSVWFYYTGSGSLTPDTAFPAWVSGNTYISGGSYFLDGNGAKEAIGCYSESDNVAAVSKLSRIMGGTNANVISLDDAGDSGSFWTGSRIKSGGLEVEATRPGSAPSSVKMMPPSDPNVFLSLFFENGPSSGTGLRWDSTKNLVRAFGTSSSGSWPVEITTDLSTLSAGRGATDGPKQGDINFPNGLFMGVSTIARFLGYDAAAPTSGVHAKGDTLLNRSPTVQTDTNGVEWIVLGWKCTANGNPGTWKTLWTQVSNPPGLV